MNCFKLVKAVLDEQYGAISRKEADKDKAICKALDYLTECYGKARRPTPRCCGCCYEALRNRDPI